MTRRLQITASPATIALTLVVALTVLGLLVVVAPAGAASAGGSGPSLGTLIKTGEDVTIPQGTTADNVVAFGGSITIAGTVRDTVAGFGADVTLQPSARVGTAGRPGDTSLIVVGGSLTTAPGATVIGKTTSQPLTGVRDAFTTGFWRPIASPFAGSSLLGWVASTVLLILIGLLVAAVLPRQVRAADQRIGSHFWSSLGWGALTAFVIVPLVMVALVITIVGILVAIPLAFVVAGLFLFGFMAFSAFLGRSLLRLTGSRGDSLYLAMTVGIVATQLIRLIPYVGTGIVALMWITGTGASIAAFFSWRRSRGKMGDRRADEGEGPERDLRVAA